MALMRSGAPSMRARGTRRRAPAPVSGPRTMRRGQEESVGSGGVARGARAVCARIAAGSSLGLTLMLISRLAGLVLPALVEVRRSTR